MVRGYFDQLHLLSRDRRTCRICEKRRRVVLEEARGLARDNFDPVGACVECIFKRTSITWVDR